MIKPFDNYVVLEEEIETKTDSGLILAENANIERTMIAKVVAVGLEVKKVQLEDRVCFKYHMFEETLIDKKKYLVGKEEGIFAHA